MIPTAVTGLAYIVNDGKGKVKLTIYDEQMQTQIDRELTVYETIEFAAALIGQARSANADPATTYQMLKSFGLA